MKTPRNIDTLTQGSNHLTFINEIISRNKITPDFEEKVRKEILEINNRLIDENLYITIVGEASTGKSTIINALINETLLKAGANTMTTAIATFIKYGEELSLEVRFKNKQDAVLFGIENTKNQNINHKYEIISSNVEIDQTYLWKVSKKDEPIYFAGINGSIKNLIPRLTATNSMAKHIVGITISLPSDFLKSGVVIIDTPGANAPNKEHVEITKSAVRKSDSSLIVTSGDKTISKWLKDTLGDVNFLYPLLHQCAFMISRMDLARLMMRRKSQDEAIKEIREDTIVRLKNGLREIGITKEPRVYHSAAQAIIDEISGEEPEIIDEEERKYWKEEFFKFKKDFRNYMLHRRAETIAERVLRLLEETFNSIENHFAILWKSYKNQENQLNIVTKDIRLFCNEQEKIWNAKIIEKSTYAVDTLKYKLLKDKQSSYRDIERLISGASDQETLKRNVSDKIQRILNESEAKAEKNLLRQNRVTQEVSIDFNEAFELKFKILYDRLQVLNKSNLLTNINRDNQIRKSRRVSIDKSTFADNQSDKMIGGAFIGGVLGSAIPIVGTVVGAFIGGFVGSLLGPSLKEEKEKIWKDLRPRVLDYYEKLADEVISLQKRHDKNIKIDVQNHLAYYNKTYRSEIERMKEIQAEERNGLSRLQNNLKQDLEKLRKRREDVIEQKQKLRQQ